MSTSTISSLALLKTRFDVQHTDFIDTLRPFISYVISKSGLKTFESHVIQQAILNEFGLALPRHTVDLVLRRFCKDNQLEKSNNQYVVIGIENSLEEFEAARKDSLNHQDSTVKGLIEHAKNRLETPLSNEDAEGFLNNYIDQYSIECIKAFKEQSIVPVHGSSKKNWHYIVSSYCNYISNEDPEQFRYLVTVVIGRMLSNALLGEDLSSIKMNFKDTSAYLDTPILLRLLGLLGEIPKLLAEEMLLLLSKAEARIAVFDHNLDEIEAILKSAEHFLLQASGGHGDVLINLREVGYTPSDVAMVRATIPDRLSAHKVYIDKTPEYVPSLQIDEAALVKEMESAGVFYRADAAKRCDINSIRSIYVLRRGTHPRRVEDSKAIFVTNNAGLARAAYAYGRRHEESSELSTAITDFSLTNLLWLKSPVDYIEVPRAMIAANCFAALRPTEQFWAHFLNQVEKLSKEGKVTPAQHQYLRFELRVRNDLMNLTFGNEEELTEDQILLLVERHEHDLKAPLEAQVSELKTSYENAANDLREIKGTLGTIDSRISEFGKYIRWVLNFVLLALATILIALTHGWIGNEWMENLPAIPKVAVRGLVYLTDLFILLHILFHVSAFNPISYCTTKLEKLIVRNLRSFLGFKD